MARISGVTIPAEKQIWVALTYVYGIGPKTADDILAAAKVERTVRTKDLTDAEIARIQDFINETYTGVAAVMAYHAVITHYEHIAFRNNGINIPKGFGIA